MSGLFRAIKESDALLPLKKIKRTIYELFFSRILNKKVVTVKKRLKEENKYITPIRVLFIMQFPEMWNSERTVYDAMCQDVSFEVSVLAIPKRRGVNSNDAYFYESNEAYNYCIQNNIKAINAMTQNGWIEIDELNADYIFLQRPYVDDLPNKLNFNNLSKHALLCYIPYGFEFVNGIHLNIEYNDELLKNLYIAFADNDVTYDFIREKSVNGLKIGARKIFNFGYPRFDLLNNSKTVISQRKSVLWLPRWSISEQNDKTGFFDYLDLLLDYFENKSEYDLVIRPHPLMFTNFIEKDVMTQDEVNNIYKRVEKMGNVMFDSNVNYIDTFDKADLLIADFTSLIIEFFALKKPII